MLNMDQIFSTIVKYGEIGLVVASLSVIVYIFSMFMKYINNTEVRRNDYDASLVSAIENNTKMMLENTNTVKEIGDYIKIKNGSFEKIIDRTNLVLNDCPYNRKKK